MPIVEYVYNNVSVLPYSCAYVLICESDENRLLAESMLNTITRLMSDHVTALEQKNAEVCINSSHMQIR